ncbi:putative gustatory receptor 28a [Neodiprion lecontei]|uniref:Gustatory receptor n=1 Tax=Neodiprion lecontei TaxID=441921 RepID=A0ABM3FIP5_NEOLC|nr:putative gustatory receptor 28a [Neodiprion lecontei]
MAAKYSVKFFWIIKVMVYVFKILGLATFSVENFDNSICTWAVDSSNLGLAYNILLSIALSILTAVSFWKSVSMNYDNKSSLTAIHDAVLGLSVSCTAWVVIVSWAFKQSKAVDIANKMLLLNFYVTSKKERSKKRTFVTVCLYVTINACFWIYEYIQEIFRPTVPTLVFIYFTVPYFIVSSFMVEYCMVVRLIIKEFEKVNEILSDYDDFRTNLYPRTQFLNYSNLEAFFSPNNSQLIMLQSVHKIRTMLFEISSDISDFFSFPILLCIGTSFYAILTHVYYLITPFVAPNAVFSLPLFLSTVLLIIVIAYPIVLLVYNTEQAMYKAKLSSRVVHELLSKTTKPEIKSELTEFSLRILHEELNFTAYGFFRLDFTLLHSMLAALVTYLVILVQYSG